MQYLFINFFFLLCQFHMMGTFCTGTLLQPYIHLTLFIIQPWDLLQAIAPTLIIVTCVLKLDGPLHLKGLTNTGWYSFLKPSLVLYPSVLILRCLLVRAPIKHAQRIGLHRRCHLDSCFLYCTPATWNTLQNDLKLTSVLSLGQFKSLIVSHFTSNHSCF